MERNHKDMALLGGSVAGFAILSLSFLLMPLDTMTILSGALFWAGLLAGAGIQIALSARRKALFRKYNVNCKTMQKPRNGLLSFASNKIALVADIVCAVSIIATVLSFVLTNGTGYMCYVSLAMLVFSFSAHCIFNGRIYFYIQNREKICQALEQKKANHSNKGEGKNGK